MRLCSGRDAISSDCSNVENERLIWRLSPIVDNKSSRYPWNTITKFSANMRVF